MSVRNQHAQTKSITIKCKETNKNYHIDNGN